MKTTVEIDDSLYREAKALGALTRRKMKDLVSEGLRQILHPLQEQPPPIQAFREFFCG